MPEAIATTKRKFYKALDALSATTAPSTDTTGSVSSNKRTSSAAAAFDEARERARKRLRHSTSTTSLNDASTSVISLPRRVLGPIQAARDPSKPPPHFSPWSQAAFLARLKTFSSVSQWHPKPDLIGEVEWAKRGWVCVDVNTVACKGGCEQRLVVSLNVGRRPNISTDTDGDGDATDDADALEEALAERYREEIVEGHSSSCLWHKAGCKDDIYRLPVVRPSIWQPELRQRFNSLLQIESSIDKVRIRPLDDSSEKIMKDLPGGILEADASQPIVQRAFVISMHGWRGTIEAGNELLQCNACFQRIGLWMYQPGYRRSKKDSNDEEEDDEDCPIIDLVELHREHCPWRNPTTQKASGSLSGLHACQILHRVASTCARDHRRRSHDHESIVQEDQVPDSPRVLSREEVARQDKERESRMRKLKNLFSIKRKSTTKTPTKSA